MTILNNARQRVTLPEVLLYAVILALPFEELFTFGGGAITKWLGLSFVVASLLETRTFYKAFPLIFLCYLLYVAIGVGGDLVRETLSLSLLNQTMGPLLTCIFMIAAYNLAANRSLPRLFFMLSLSAALFAVFQYFGLANAVTNTSSQVVTGESLDRVSALATDPNFAACFMSLAAIPGVLAVSGALPMATGYRVLSVIGALVAAGGIIMTGSRGGLLALVLGITSVLFVTRNWIVSLKILCVSGGVLGILGVAVLHDPLFRARLEASIENRDTSTREDIWQDSLSLFTQSSIFGFGNRNYMSELGQFRGEYQKGTHNVPLSVLLATGAVGSLAFLCFYMASARAAWRYRKSGMGMLLFPWFVIAFVGGMSLNLEIAKWYWLITALALAIPKSQAQELETAALQASSPNEFADVFGQPLRDTGQIGSGSGSPMRLAIPDHLNERDDGLWLKNGAQRSEGTQS